MRAKQISKNAFDAFGWRGPTVKVQELFQRQLSLPMRAGTTMLESRFRTLPPVYNGPNKNTVREK